MKCCEYGLWGDFHISIFFTYEWAEKARDLSQESFPAMSDQTL
jgi:hypothetical protein